MKAAFFALSAVVIMAPHATHNQARIFAAIMLINAGIALYLEAA